VERKVPDKRKKKGVFYAVTDDGIELPVVDITHPTFALEVSQGELSAISEETLQSLQKTSRMPSLVLRLMARHSITMRETTIAAGSPQSGMATYLEALGPVSLGEGYEGKIDRRVVATIGPVSARLRLRDVARLTAEGLAPALSARRGPLHLINIGGGPAADSCNALILLRKEHPEWLEGRQIFIHVIDLDSAGPHFGYRVLSALVSEEGPLSGLQAAFVHIECDWADTTGLGQLIGSIDEPDSVVASSSEGGLFEYGSDEEIVASLRALHGGTPGDTRMTGAIARDDTLMRMMKDAAKMTLHPRRLEAFADLAAGAGWAVDRSVEGNPLYHIVRLRKT
jgi:hypothetical protein